MLEFRASQNYLICIHIIFRQLEGDFLKSTTLKIKHSPNRTKILSEGMEIDCKTPGSVNLILQLLLPSILFYKKQNESFELIIKGGTFVSFSPTSFSQKNVFFKLLQKFGVHLNYQIIKNGCFPNLMGLIKVNIPHVETFLNPIQLTSKGNITKIKICLSSK